MRISTRLIRSQDNMVVEADLLDLTQKHTGDYNSRWKEQLKLFGQSDKFWDWEFKREFVINKQPNREGYAIEYEGQLQFAIRFGANAPLRSTQFAIITPQLFA